MTTTPGQAPAVTMAPTGQRPAIDLSSVTKSFGKVHAVRGIDLQVQPGEVVAFLGPNGAGKTTTIDMLLGLSKPDSGTVEVFGMHPRQAVARGLVAAVMQTGGLLKDLSVRETVQLTASLFVQTRSPQECLERAGIADIADRKVSKCSGGQQQRLRFAMALVSDPALIVLDEPTTGMDVTGRRDFWNAIHRDAERGRTVLFATHYLEEADMYADRIVLLRQGQIVADGTGPQIKAMTSGRTVRATLPGADEHALAALAGVDSIEVRGDSVMLHSRDSDAVARFLLTQTPARDIEIEARGLEDAFIALTSDDSDNNGQGEQR
ncbi:ABC transporter ATP-binding protein [Rudaeicoccus suwonensis]|nr:ABC transporter ATP-binding protein [Rudaeicoccus suwonensis]